MMIDEIATITPSWISDVDDRDADPITLYSSARLRRNAAGYPFPNTCSRSQLYDLAAMMLGKVGRSSILPDHDFQMIDELSGISRSLLLESYTITDRLAEGGPGRFLMRDTAGVMTCMINEDDHLCTTAVLPGLALREALKRASDLVDDIDIKSAHDPVLGFLTASPDHVGTGTEVAVLMHLPALDISGEMGRAERDFERERGAMATLTKLPYDGMNNSCGSLYIVANKVTIGVSPEEIADSINEASHSIASKERFSRHKLMHSKSTDMMDRFWRAWGLLQYARKLTYPEAINKISFVKLGSDLGILPKISESEWRRSIISTRRAHLCLANGRELDHSEEPFIRASAYRRYIDKAGASAPLTLRPSCDKEMQE